MGMVSRYMEPTNAGEMALLIQTFITAEFGWGCSGGSNGDGGDLEYELDDDAVSVVVGPTDKLFAIKRMLDGDGRFTVLDEDEIELIEAHRAGRRKAPRRAQEALEPSEN